jgi:acetate kinase
MGPLVGTVHLGQVRKLYRLTLMNAQARRLARRIEAVGKRVNGPEDAFKARLMIGGQVVEFVSHVPSLPIEIWDDVTGVRDLISTYSRFEARVVVRANTFVREIVSGRRRLETPMLPSRRPRGAKPRMSLRGRPAR